MHERTISTHDILAVVKEIFETTCIICYNGDGFFTHNFWLNGKSRLFEFKYNMIVAYKERSDLFLTVLPRHLYGCILYE